MQSTRECASAAALLAVLLVVFVPCSVHGDGDWTEGRATFYDDNTEGSCRYGTDIPTYYGAWPDGQAGFPACGQCYEVACVNRNFRDGYGKRLVRTDACHDEDETVIVKIVDSCPCVHENFYSNQRWCCGDSAHIDIGRAAFKKLAPKSVGVVGARWRKVACPGSYGSAKTSSKSKESDDDTVSASAASSASASSASSSKSRKRKSSRSSTRWSSWFGH